MDDQLIIYRIDDSDRIVYVNEMWDEFAIENSSPEMAASNVLDREIWEFIDDITVKSIYKDMLGRVRKGNYASFNFRCDSPELMRRLMMSIAPMPGGVVEFRTQTIETANRPAVPLLEAYDPHPTQILISCSWCKKIQKNDKWLDVENAVSDLILFDRSSMPRLSHGICKTCYEEISGDLIFR